MTIDVLTAAKLLCKKSDWSLCNLKIQKILYICNAFTMGITDHPLIQGNFEAWDQGPIHPDLYHALKFYGSDPVPQAFFNDVEDPDLSLSAEEIEIIEYGAKELSNISDQDLTEFTELEGSAWRRQHRHGNKHRPIPNEDLKEEFVLIMKHCNS